MKLRFTVTSLLLGTTVCALGIFAYQQSMRITKMEAQIEIHEALRGQMQRVLQQESELQQAFDTLALDLRQNATLEKGDQRSRFIAFASTLPRQQRSNAENAVRTAKFRVMRERGLLREMERLAHQQIALD